MRFARLLVAAALLVLVPVQAALADRKTVCTITVNSPDERDIFRRYLPQDDFDFVELVERGRPDWLESACRRGVRCDVLLISGHFDDGTQFYSDRLDAREFLPVDELERVSCSESCPGLFSQLKEVYLFGCNTLNPQGLRSTTAEVVRSLVRAGQSPAEAEQVARLLDQQHADSNRDRMRQIFHDVPVIYGFSSKAPLGPTAATVLDRYFQTGGKAEVASGRASPKLLNLFAPVSMTWSPGLTSADLQAAYRRDVCEFADDRQSAAQKLAFVQQLLQRDMAQVRMFLGRIERQVLSLTPAERAQDAVAALLRDIAADAPLRQRFLDFARDADEASTRARMIELAQALGWLSVDEMRGELVHTIADRVTRNRFGPAEVDLACALESKHGLGETSLQGFPALTPSSSVAHAAALACFGNRPARVRVLQALASPNDRDVELAQVYVQHQPVADALELRAIVKAVASMPGSDAQVRALDTLARQRVTDTETLQELARLFPAARSLNVQRAIAGVLIRADYTALERPQLVRALRDHRVKSSEGPDVIDALIRRLQS